MGFIDLSGKTAVVTGAGGGIGRGVSIALAEAGCALIPANRNQESLDAVAGELKQAGAICEPCRTDVSKEEDILALAKHVRDKLGRLDILVNCAGITVKKPALEMTSEEWDRVINVNLRGVFLCCKHLGALIKDSRGSEDDYGKVINIGSVGSFLGIPHSSSYCASKGGVLMLTKVLSTEWAQYHINVNAIVPGYIETPLSAGVLANPDAFKKVTSSIPLGKLGKPHDTAHLILFLVSQYSNYITGAGIPIDGGLLSAAYTVEKKD